MAEPAQATIKEAAAYLHYSVRTVQRMIERKALPATGKGALLRVPWDALRDKLARMQKGESPWAPHPDAETTPPASAAKRARAASARTNTGKSGTPTKTSTGKLADAVRVVSNPPEWH
jgi:excisionase family DNA binding protein